MSSEIGVLAANCQGLRDKNKCCNILNYLENLNASVFCLQDTHWTECDIKRLKNVWKGECIIAGSKTNSRGVAMLLKKNFEYKIIDSFTDTIGNLISLDINISNIKLKLINVYGPNIDSPSFYKKINDIIESNDQDYIVICGDLNLVMDPNLDCQNYKHLNNPKARNELLHIMSTYNLKDLYRELNPYTKRYTWRRRNPIKQARLDYFLCSDTLVDIVNSCIIKPGYRTDHSFVIMKLGICKFRRGRGLWKLNCSLLKNKDYLILINNLIDREKLTYSAMVYNPISVAAIPNSELQFTIADDTFLKILLLKIRGETIKFASTLKEQSNELELKLDTNIENLEKECFPGSIEKLYDKKQELQNIRETKIQAIKIRSRAIWLKDGEKPSKYLTSLENKYYIEKTIKLLEKQDGQILTEQSDILNEVKSFYEHLFSKSANTSDLELANLLENSTYPKLSTVESDRLECELSLPEISKAVQNMKNGKAPGIDGFPVEFFKVFWNKLKDFVLRAYNWSYKMGNMTITLRQCVISCIPKGNKSRMLLKNWQPISLLSVVYKILSSTIANRNKTVLDSLVSKTQTGFVAGRFIGENTRLIYDILHYTEKENIPGLLMLIDFEKAFDSVSWDFLYGTLKLLGFGPKMIKLITIFNTNITGYIQQCGILSQPFPINRGCRQGDPISSYLFILSAQILQVLISENHVIKGIKINGK